VFLEKDKIWTHGEGRAGSPLRAGASRVVRGSQGTATPTWWLSVSSPRSLSAPGRGPGWPQAGWGSKARSVLCG